MFNLSRFLDVQSKLYRRVVYGLIAMTLVLGIGVTTAQPSQASWLDLIFGGVQVIQLSNMSDRQEAEIGAGINQRLINSGQVKIYRDPALNAYVSDIGQRLANASDRPDITYTFQIAEDEAVNAFAVMGGYIYVTTGLMAAADNEAELAGVMGHEIGHVTGRHSVKQMRQAAIAQGITGALGVRQDQLVNLGTQLALYLPASRSDEYEADQDGFEYMGRAGYDQSGMVSFMRKLVGNGASQPEFLSTHPDARNRVASLQQQLTDYAMPEATGGLDESSYTAQVSRLR